MRFLTFVLEVLLCFACIEANDTGGLQVHISETGINKAIDYLMDHNLVPFLKSFDAGEFSTPVGNTIILINKVKFVKLDGEYAQITFKKGNIVEILAGFTMFKLSANITIDFASAEDEYGPATVIEFLDTELNVTVSLGSNSTSLQHCTAKVGDVQAEGALEDYIKLAYGFAGGQLEDIVEKVCPYLTEQANTYLNNILHLHETFEVDLPVGEAALTVQTTSVRTDDHYIHVTAAVTFEKKETTYDNDDVIFPGTNVPSIDSDVDIWMNKRLINELLNRGIDTPAVLSTILTKEDGVAEDVETRLATTDEYATVTSKGVGYSGTSYTSFFSQSKLFETSLTYVFPVMLSLSNSELVASLDASRTQMYFKVTSENLDSLHKTDMKHLQWKILTSYRDKINDLLKAYTVRLSLPKTDMYGFEDTLLQTSKDLLSVSANLRVGPSSSDSPMTKKINQEYSDKKLEVAFLDGEKRVFETYVISGAREVTYQPGRLVVIAFVFIAVQRSLQPRF